MAVTSPETAAALSLLSAKAVRDRAERMMAIGLADRLPGFRIDLSRMDAAVELTIATTRAAYPTLDIPFHSRWRHFNAGGKDRWQSVADTVRWETRAARARAAFDLAIVSVFLDAGAGPSWRYADPMTGSAIGRSEGLGLASLAMFSDGLFSADARDRLRADAAALVNLDGADVKRGMQVSDSNPMIGIDGRADLLRRLGAHVASNADVFGRCGTARPGGFFDHLAALADHGTLPAPTILSELLHHLGPVWPSRLVLGGIALGDCWTHPAMVTNDATSGLVPFHKLSQWLAYSLIEPLQAAGVTVTDIDGLTGLAEYRNGGLFIDLGVLQLRDGADAARDHDVGSALVVEWRALTVALLDRVAEQMRHRLSLHAERLPLAKILEGGTWAAGRAAAAARRPDSSPPLRVVSDGTVF
jgi:hypothetical protein